MYGGVEVVTVIHSVTNFSTSLSVHRTGENVQSEDRQDANGTARTRKLTSVLFNYLEICCTSLNAHKGMVAKPEERDHFEDLSTDGMTLKWVLMGQEFTGFIWYDREQCQHLANMVINLHVPINRANFLTSPATVSFSRGTLLHGDSWSFVSVGQHNHAISHKACQTMQEKSLLQGNHENISIICPLLSDNNSCVFGQFMYQ